MKQLRKLEVVHHAVNLLDTAPRFLYKLNVEAEFLSVFE